MFGLFEIFVAFSRVVKSRGSEGDCLGCNLGSMTPTSVVLDKNLSKLPFPSGN